MLPSQEVANAAISVHLFVLTRRFCCEPTLRPSRLCLYRMACCQLCFHKRSSLFACARRPIEDSFRISQHIGKSELSRRKLAVKGIRRRSATTHAVFRGYLGDTRSRKHTHYSNATIDQDKEDHRQNMRTVLSELWSSL